MADGQGEYFLRTDGSAQTQTTGHVVIRLHNVLNNLEHLYSNTFRFGKVIIEIDQTQVVEVVDDLGRRCRINGPAGPRNLERFKTELIGFLFEDDVDEK